MMVRRRLSVAGLIVFLALGCGEIDGDGAPEIDDADGGEEEVSLDDPRVAVDFPDALDVPADGVELIEPEQAGPEDAAEVDPDAETEAPESVDYPGYLLLSGDHEAEEEEFFELMNAERTSRGLGTLRNFWDLELSGRDHSAVMAAQNDLHHNPNLTAVTESGYWNRLGENVGYGPSVQSIHDAFMDSPGHRDNILGDYTHAGIGVVIDGPRIWVTVVFMDAAVSGLHNTHPPFADSNFDTHDANIKKIYEAGITHGCSGGDRPRYCPNQTVTRGQMAAFLDRALGLPSASGSYFSDTAGAFYEQHADNMKEAGITHGCGGGNYCGADPVTRGQMAAFLDRALDLPQASQNYFSDTAGAFYEQHADNLKEAGITHGCGGDDYCGEDPVTRAQMASFLARALEL